MGSGSGLFRYFAVRVLQAVDVVFYHPHVLLSVPVNHQSACQHQSMKTITALIIFQTMVVKVFTNLSGTEESMSSLQNLQNIYILH